jgi:hypothetical protein
MYRALILETMNERQISEEPKARRPRAITVTDITTAVAELAKKPFNAATFPFDILTIYRDTPKTTLAKIKNGTTNPAHDSGGVLLKKVLYFQACGVDEDPGSIAESLISQKITEKNTPRFILVTNGQVVHIRDLKSNDAPCNRAWNEDEYWGHFLLPLNPKFDRLTRHEEHPADVKAATVLRRLYEAILKASPTWADGNHTHQLNVFMTRVLFCLYAEDTGIFDKKNLFTDTVEQYSNIDGHDVAELLDRLFRIMNVEKKNRPSKISPIESEFPYVNGNLFEATMPIPTFDRLARRSLLECGRELNWTEINPDIFGSMIQTIADVDTRASIGMHYTSSTNIMKVLGPLFLENLTNDFVAAKDNLVALEALRTRLGSIRVFDPACGSGNFLILAYKALRRLEMRIISRISEITPNMPLRLSVVSLSRFYGADVIDFACETARLSLWIAEHQMNREFHDSFGVATPTLPLATINTIYNVNSLRRDWSDLCPDDARFETYICGNPPYLGSTNQSESQKEDIARLFVPFTKQRLNLDYVSGFFLKAAICINAKGGKAAFVSTNSICQGEQVPILWPLLYGLSMDIAFAHTSFKWENHAANNAGVSCIIVGLTRNTDPSPRKVFENEHVHTVRSIGPYLVPNTRQIVQKSTEPINDLPLIIEGSRPIDDGHFILSPLERANLLAEAPETERFIRPYMGSDDFFNRIERYCIWIRDDEIDLAKQIPAIQKRVERVRSFRLASTAKTTRQYAQNPYRFRPNRYSALQDAAASAIIIPAVASERRKYVVAGITAPGTIINNLAFACYKSPAWMLALISSRLHRLWAGAVGGSLETRIRYSSTLVYNTFPIPTLSAEQKKILATNVRAILRARESHPQQTLAVLYDPKLMPIDLEQAHRDNDGYIEEYIYGRTFSSDTARLDLLFSMYERSQREVRRDGLLSLGKGDG